MITPLDMWAGGAAAIAAAAMGLRANMLKPNFQRWRTPPAAVWISLTVCSAILGGAALSLLTGDTGIKGTAREAVVYTILAVTSLILVWNLHRQKHHPATTPGVEVTAKPDSSRDFIEYGREVKRADSNVHQLH